MADPGMNPPIICPPQFIATEVEYVPTNLAVNVRDYLDKPVVDAEVTITDGTFVNTGKTNVFGCYKATVRPLTEYEMQISAIGLADYEHSFMLYPAGNLTAPITAKQLVIQVKSVAGAIISGANVTVTPFGGGTTINGTTNSEGIFQHQLTTIGKSYTIQISKASFITYLHVLVPFTKFSCDDTSYRVVPVIKMQPS